jgi:hypothetical protein
MTIEAKPVIERYLRPENYDRVQRDFKSVIRLINSSYGEYSLQLREDCFNIYYQGNSIAKIEPNKNGTYTASIHSEFVKDLLEDLGKYSDVKHSSNDTNSNSYLRFRIQPDNLHRFFQRKHLNGISGKIRSVHNGKEITMEQVIVTDNPPSRDYIIIDRQVADHTNWSRVDLLSLKRDSTDKYYFVVIEVKLGRNPELRGKAGAQVSRYVRHIRENMDDYGDCYELNYRQKKGLGLFGEEMPDSIAINREKSSVKGLVVSCGYSQVADENIKSLNRVIRNSAWGITAYQMPRMKLSDI